MAKDKPDIFLEKTNAGTLAIVRLGTEVIFKKLYLYYNRQEIKHLVKQELKGLIK